MSASARARASKKYKTRKGGYGPRTGTPMSGAERVGRFRERLKTVRARSVNDADSANTSISAADHGATPTTAVLVPMDMMSGDINHISVESGTTCLSLRPYSANMTKLLPSSQPDLETPIVLCGDFNNDPRHNNYLVDFMKNESGLN